MPIKPGAYADVSKMRDPKQWKQAKGEPEGVVEAILHRHSDGSYSHFLRIPAGVKMPEPVVHDFYEEAYYIDGEMLNTKTGEMIRGGSYIFHEPGEAHGPFRCLKACLLLEFRYYK